jgi:hypothetical protein
MASAGRGVHAAEPGRPARRHAGALRGARGPHGARPHCLFRNKGGESLSKSCIKGMSGSTKRQCTPNARSAPLSAGRSALASSRPTRAAGVSPLWGLGAPPPSRLNWNPRQWRDVRRQARPGGHDRPGGVHAGALRPPRGHAPPSPSLAAQSPCSGRGLAMDPRSDFLRASPRDTFAMDLDARVCCTAAGAGLAGRGGAAVSARPPGPRRGGEHYLLLSTPHTM